MSTFANLIRQSAQTENLVHGAKGLPGYATTGDAVMNFNNKVIQNSERADIERYLSQAFVEANSRNDPYEIVDILITTINKRAIRDGGEGARDAFYHSLLYIYEHHYPEYILNLIRYVPDFGYFKDLTRILKFINDRAPAEILEGNNNLTTRTFMDYFNQYDPLVREIARVLFLQIEKDHQELTTNPENPSISLVGKWMPRENRSEDRNIFWFLPMYSANTNTNINPNPVNLYRQGIANYLTRYRYMSNPIRETSKKNVGKIPPYIHKDYRRLISTLNKALETPSIYQCAQRYGDINLRKATSKFLFTQRLALLNERKKVPVLTSQSNTGNRFPDNPDRVQCRKNFLEFLPDMKGAVNAIYDIYRAIQIATSSTEIMVLEAQWRALRNEIKSNVTSYREELQEKINRLCEEKGISAPPPAPPINFLPMIDVSPSMNSSADTPSIKMTGRANTLTCMDLAISIGIMASELNDGPFRNMAMSFSSTPKFIDFTRKNPRDNESNKSNGSTELTLMEKISAVKATMGYTTDIKAAYSLILDFARKHNVVEEELPQFIVLTDEGFDVHILGGGGYIQVSEQTVNANFRTLMNWIDREFRNYNYSKATMMYFWNLSASNRGFQTQANRPNTSLLQGFSANSLKFALTGNLAAQVAVLSPNAGTSNSNGKSVTTDSLANVEKTPYDDFRGMVDQDQYDIFRYLAAQSTEGLLKNYQFNRTNETPLKVRETEEPTRSNGNPTNNSNPTNPTNFQLEDMVNVMSEVTTAMSEVTTALQELDMDMPMPNHNSSTTNTENNTETNTETTTNPPSQSWFPNLW